MMGRLCNTRMNYLRNNNFCAFQIIYILGIFEIFIHFLICRELNKEIEQLLNYPENIYFIFKYANYK